MSTPDHSSAAAPGRAGQLRAATHDAHEALDERIMAGAPFADRERYGAFLQVQYQFHRDIDALYDNPALDRLLPDLPGRRRLGLVAQDLADLGIAIPAASAAPEFDANADLPTALGWLYAAEGSNLGAAFLLKDAAKLGFTETCGARHLAAAPEGRGKQWKTFTAALDSLSLDAAEEQNVIAGGRAAFIRVRELVEALLPRTDDNAPIRAA
ncbi:biliverdin-producing heme oxygenase [Tardiphaga alba]|uniref:Biliverdin-producing heme oxygenase n=1 Tax=Tardiphaga alba TaxID=340268 RepID=A0ABX8AC21_9BRAD|nr:biliverdin-producing heme oxygenase [Tardiphaga alba]QUS40511.1 biliverdin-producing heme oxygenase [Tardiphaga alba]